MVNYKVSEGKREVRIRYHLQEGRMDCSCKRKSSRCKFQIRDTKINRV